MNGRTDSEKKPEQATTSIGSHATTCFEQPITLLQGASRSCGALSDIHIGPITDLEEECSKCIETVQKKMAWARLSLERDTDPNVVAAYLKVITGCVETINTLRKFSC